ncbi:hypothetical protein LCGC14_2886900 [marine sediment metagenome]|uniref:Uncharacterized protein n=1 Tax=marine sediment metagenome TaxID=412755 RepID=A0A0F9A6D1_9ZZZZ
MIAHAEVVTALNAWGFRDQPIADLLGVSRERVRQIRVKLGIAKIPGVTHCRSCGVVIPAKTQRCVDHKQKPSRIIEAPHKRALSTDPKAVYQRTYQARRIARGQCPVVGCPESPRAPGTNLCEEHRKAMLKANLVRNAGRKAQGLCIRCGKPVEGTHVLCTEHHDANLWSARQHDARRLNVAREA